MLTDDVGIIQHAHRDGAESEDRILHRRRRARVHASCLRYLRLDPGDRLQSSDWPRPTFPSSCTRRWRTAGSITSWITIARWLDEVGTPDSCGRAIWALGYGTRECARRRPWRRVCAAGLDRALPTVRSLGHIRSRAYAAIGLAHADRRARIRNTPMRCDRSRPTSCATPTKRRAAETGNGSKMRMIYDNARLSEAMIRAGAVLARRASRGRSADSRVLRKRHDRKRRPRSDRKHGWYTAAAPRALRAAAPRSCRARRRRARGLRSHRRCAPLASAELALEWYYGKNSRGDRDGARRRMLRRSRRRRRQSQYGCRIDAGVACGGICDGRPTAASASRGALDPAVKRSSFA